MLTLDAVKNVFRHQTSYGDSGFHRFGGEEKNMDPPKKKREPQESDSKANDNHQPPG